MQLLLAMRGVDYKEVWKLEIKWDINEGVDIRVMLKPKAEVVYVSIVSPDPVNRLTVPNVDGGSH